MFENKSGILLIGGLGFFLFAFSAQPDDLPRFSFGGPSKAFPGLVPGEVEALFEPAFRIEVLDADAIARIHEATLHVIEHVGIRFPSERALDIWAAAGAEVDRESQVVKAPKAMIPKVPPNAPVCAYAVRVATSNAPVQVPCAAWKV